MMDKQKLVELLEQLKANSKKRRFVQSVDLELKLKNVDVSKPENSFTETYSLPKGFPGKRRRVCVFADGASLPRARESGADAVMTRSEIEALAGDKKAVKKLAKKYDFFVADVALMPTVGRVMGQVLGPRGKMPTPFPVNTDPKPIVERLRNSVLIKLKGQPVIRCMVGSEDMNPADLAENILDVVNHITQKVKGGRAALDHALIKMSMSKPFKIDFR
ncbi:MAG: 50S ribosomal protein L1 [Thermoprotei archaeon]